MMLASAVNTCVKVTPQTQGNDEPSLGKRLVLFVKTVLAYPFAFERMAAKQGAADHLVLAF